ncbi:MAG: hypothetical protein DRG33_07645, partial [Deltaproteobacteria bacterium]
MAHGKRSKTGEISTFILAMMILAATAAVAFHADQAFGGTGTLKVLSFSSPPSSKILGNQELAGFSLIIEGESGFSGSGSGTPEDPYVITNVQQLQEMKYDLDAYYVLGNDIDASETVDWNGGAGFEPVGSEIRPEFESLLWLFPSHKPTRIFKSFDGTLDGRDHKILHLHINNNSDRAGLFSVLTGTVKDLVLEDVSVSAGSGTEKTGALAGLANATIEDVHVTGTVTGYNQVGGLVGHQEGGLIADSSSNANVVANNWCAGGLVGLAWGTVSKSHSS